MGFSDILKVAVPSLIGAALGGPAGAAVGASVGGAWSAASSAEEANKTNVELQRENQSWEETLANSAHQREVADLKAAGLNPILSARLGGSATPVVAPARVESLAPTYLSSARQFSETSLSSRSLIADLAVKKAQAENNSAQATQARASANLSNTSAQGVAIDNARKISELPGKVAEGKAEGSIPWWARSASKWYKGTVENVAYPFEKAAGIFKGTSYMPSYSEGSYSYSR